MTFGSSLVAMTDPLAWRATDWSLTTLPLGRFVCSVMSNWISTSLLTGRLRLRMSTTPVPLAPPTLLVNVTSAPGGTVTSVSEPGTNAGGALSASSSSKIRKSLSAWLVVRKRNV